MTTSPYNQPQIPDLETDETMHTHIACESGRAVQPNYAATICGFAVPLAGDLTLEEVAALPQCPRCVEIDETGGVCRSCKQTQLLGWAKRIGVDDTDMRYDAMSDLLVVNYTFDRPVDEKKENHL